MTLLSLASKQIWPHVLAIAHVKARRVVLLHSPEADESRGPANRLIELLSNNSEFFGITEASTFEIPHDDFDAVQAGFENLRIRDGLTSSGTLLNFTGGNKLMATAAFEWARVTQVPAFYLERGNKLFHFFFEDCRPRVEAAETIAPELTDALGAIQLLKCQLGPAVIKSAGECLTLNETGQRVQITEVASRLKKDVRLDRGGFDFRKWLDPGGITENREEPGFNLEYGVAVMLLKLGVPRVHRSVELKPRAARFLAEGELDLVFNWNGKLWVVDCKDKAGVSGKINALRTAILKQAMITPDVEKQLATIANDLAEKDVKILREDLLQISETGGLLGRAVCVRQSPLPEQAQEFARSRNLGVILKDRLLQDLDPLLHPRKKPSADQLNELASILGRK